MRFSCDCGYQKTVPSEWAGKRAKCPKCGEVHRIVQTVQAEVVHEPQNVSVKLPAYQPPKTERNIAIVAIGIVASIVWIVGLASIAFINKPAKEVSEVEKPKIPKVEKVKPKLVKAKPVVNSGPYIPQNMFTKWLDFTPTKDMKKLPVGFQGIKQQLFCKFLAFGFLFFSFGK